MRNFLSAVMVAGAVASTGLLPAPAMARDYPFCIYGANYLTRDCSFDTYQQCLATASGRYAYCEANPFFANARRPDVEYPKKPRRQQQM
jgi:hypothetical protein